MYRSYPLVKCMFVCIHINNRFHIRMFSILTHSHILNVQASIFFHSSLYLCKTLCWSGEEKMKQNHIECGTKFTLGNVSLSDSSFIFFIDAMAVDLFACTKVQMCKCVCGCAWVCIRVEHCNRKEFSPHTLCAV